MQSDNKGAIHLGRIAGVDLYLHWSWFLVAAIEIQSRSGMYGSYIWNVLEYLALFAIVLTHEFGHAMACRSVGGTANKILLWPFGGVAYVNPPQRPGATLWSIAAGPLVNVALIPILLVATTVSGSLGWQYSHHDVYLFLQQILWIDIILLVFNMLPSYPLDGGQILRSLLWFVIGRGRSLMVACVVGLVGGVAMIGLAIWERSFWTAAVAAYMLMNCWTGLKRAKAIRNFEKLPNRPEFACPSCRTPPLIGPYWHCDGCEQQFDTFETHAVCPHCTKAYPTTMCLACREQGPMSEWVVAAAPHSGVVSSSFEAK